MYAIHYLRAVITLLWLQVVAATREHFNCPDVSGARVENEGGPLTQGWVCLCGGNDCPSVGKSNAPTLPKLYIEQEHLQLL